LEGQWLWEITAARAAAICWALVVPAAEAEPPQAAASKHAPAIMVVIATNQRRVASRNSLNFPSPPVG
jgi:hypothetical protein